MSQKTITLPERDEMLERLVAVNSNAHYQQKFYPRLLRLAGQELIPMGLVTELSLAILDYTEGLPPTITALMYMEAPEFIDVLIDDEELMTEAREFLQMVSQ